MSSCEVNGIIIRSGTSDRSLAAAGTKKKNKDEDASNLLELSWFKLFHEE